MGQQQLLLIVLSAIIVGVSIIVGLNMFSSSAVQSNIDAVTQDVMTIASRAQEWWRKPAQMGGGGRDWTGVSLIRINFPDSTINGSYAVSIVGSNLQIVGTGIEDGDGDGTPISVTTTVDSTNIISTVVAD
ncbi:MAG: hypothetical protein ACE5HX_11940 [bacterium]